MSPLDYMRLAIKMSEQARYQAPPNPWVGCVIVNNGKIVGQGCTQPPGQSHAEIQALKEAQGFTQGATLYVTLEPCAHTGRTPPCTNAIIQSGIKTVYVGIEDPDERVKGKGIEQLRQAGIEVFIGIESEIIQHSLKPYLYHRQTKLPYTILKTAISIDGKIAAEDGTSQWITCVEARKDVHHQRALSQAIVVGSLTAMKDNPRLTTRMDPPLPLAQQPLRVLIDSTGKVPATGSLFDQQLAPTLVFTTLKAPMTRLDEWKCQGADVQIVSLTSEGLHLEEAWKIMGQKGILQVLVEGGALLQRTLLTKSLCQEFLVYIGPLLMGSTGKTCFPHSFKTLTEAYSFDLEEARKIGQSVRLRYYPKNLNDKEKDLKKES